MTPPRISSNSLLNSADQHDSNDSVSGTRNEEVEGFSNEEEQKLSGCSEAPGDSSGKDPPSLASFHGNIGTKHLLSNGEDEIDGCSKKRKSEKLPEETAKATENAKNSVQLDKVDIVTKDEVTKQLICHQKQSPKFQKHEDTTKHSPSSTTEEEVLTVLFGTYFDARDEQRHLLEALQAVVRASGGSLKTIQFLTEICCAADRQFVGKTVFQSESLTPTVARWVVDWTKQQDGPFFGLVPLLQEFVCGSAPLAAGHLLLQHVDVDTQFSFVSGDIFTVWLWCLVESSDRVDVNDSRVISVLRNSRTLSWRDGKGRSALHHAAIHGRLRITAFLVNERNMDVNQQLEGENCGFTALMLAAGQGHTEVARFLALRPLANLDLRDYDGGLSALHYAALFNRLETVTLLVNELNMDVNQRTRPGGISALMIAIGKGFTETAKFLALHPLANLEVLDDDGLNALDYAANFNRPEVSGILESRRDATIAATEPS